MADNLSNTSSDEFQSAETENSDSGKQASATASPRKKKSKQQSASPENGKKGQRRSSPEVVVVTDPLLTPPRASRIPLRKDSISSLESTFDDLMKRKSRNEEPASTTAEESETSADVDKPNKSLRKKIGNKEYSSRAEKTQSARKRGDSMKKKAEEFEKLCGGKVYLKAQYVGYKNSPYTWQHGQNFKLVGETPTKDDQPEKAKISKSSLHELASTVKSAIAETLSKKSMKEPEAGTSKSGSSQAKYPSPEKTKLSKPGRFSKKGVCHVCGNLEVTIGPIYFNSQLVACEYRGCTAWTHLDCLGFPGVTEKEALDVPSYYCQNHIASGRRDKKVKMSYLEEDPVPPRSTKSRKGKVFSK